MTAMPQLVSLFNAVGGGAAALVAIDDFIRLSTSAAPPVDTTIFVVLGARHRLGHVHRLADRRRQAPGPHPGQADLSCPGGQFVTIALAVIAVLGTVALILGAAGTLTLSSDGDAARPGARRPGRA